MPSYQRILLKLSGEALGKQEKSGIDLDKVFSFARELKDLREEGIQIGVVTGAGNLIRGVEATSSGIKRDRVDQVGMLATTLNGMMLAEALETLGCPSTVIGAFACGSIISTGNAKEAVIALEQGKVVIFVGGTGNPYFTTDTAAALRACEIQADVLIKATKVDGIFDQDPLKNPHAVKIEKTTYHHVLKEGLSVMDASAIALCQENTIPIHILNIYQENALKDAIYEQKGGSIVTGESSCLKMK
ncbi:MAG: UMP kinase [Candidatus Rhabdochlamydia sp.]